MTEATKRLMDEMYRLAEQNQKPGALTVSPDDYACLEAEAGAREPGKALGFQGPLGWVAIKAAPGEPSQEARAEAARINEERARRDAMMEGGVPEFMDCLRHKSPERPGRGL